jgi:hypothetical protein
VTSHTHTHTTCACAHIHTHCPSLCLTPSHFHTHTHLFPTASSPTPHIGCHMAVSIVTELDIIEWHTVYTHTHTHTHAYIYIYIYMYDSVAIGWCFISDYTECIRGNLPCFGRMFHRSLLHWYDQKCVYLKLNGYRDNGERSVKYIEVLHIYGLPNMY